MLHGHVRRQSKFLPLEDSSFYLNYILVVYYNNIPTTSPCSTPQPRDVSQTITYSFSSQSTYLHIWHNPALKRLSEVLEAPGAEMVVYHINNHISINAQLGLRTWDLVVGGQTTVTRHRLWTFSYNGRSCDRKAVLYS